MAIGQEDVGEERQGGKRRKHANDKTAPTRQGAIHEVHRRPPGRDATGEDVTGMRRGRSRAEKMSLYIPGDVLADIRAEARRQQRSVSWLIRSAWRLARQGIDAFPAAPEWDSKKDSGPLPDS